MFAIIAAHTGLRKRNVIRLRWDQVDLVNKRIFINSHKGKGKLILAMHDDLHGIFMKQYRSYGPEKSEYVICKPDGQRFTDVPGWRDAQKRAGMPKFCFKNLRNTYCSWHVENGAEMGLIQRALGHTTISTTARFYNKAQAASTMLVQSQRSLLSAAGSA